MKKTTNNLTAGLHLRSDFTTPNPDTSGWGRNVKLSYCEFMQKNKPQSNSVAGGILVLGAGGFHIAWLLWNLSRLQVDITTTALFFQYSCWYLGNIVGSILGAMLVTKWQKKNIYYLFGTIAAAGAVIFIGGYQISWLIAVGRLVAGVGHGLAYVTTITHGAENVIKEMRGRLIASVHFLIYSAVLMFSVIAMYSYPYPGGIRVEQLLGIVAAAFALMAIMFTPCFTYESITYLLYRNNDRQAVENMIKLRNESVVTWSISNDLQEMKLMVAEDRMKTGNITKDNNTRPLLLMMAISVIVALSSNLILNKNLIELTGEAFLTDWDDANPNTLSRTSIASVILVSFRYVAGLLMVTFGDSFSRKKILRLTAGLAALCLFVIHIISPYTLNYTNGVNWIPGVFAVAFQFFVGVGVEPMQHVLMSEAFSTAKKYWSIACITITESLIQIAIIGLSFIDDQIFISIFVYCSVVIIAAMTVILHMKLPETRGMSLRQARDEFTKTGLPEGITYS